MKIEKIDDKQIRIVYEEPHEVKFMENINNERSQLEQTIIALAREVKALEEELHTLQKKDNEC